MKKLIQLIAAMLLLIASPAYATTTATATYYFNGINGATDWTDDANAADGNVNTWAYAAYVTYYYNNGNVLLEYNSNTCPGTFNGSISKVEMRFYTYGYCEGGTGSLSEFIFWPYGASSTQTIWSVGPVEEKGEGWSSWVDVTTLTGAPTWKADWNEVKNISPVTFAHMVSYPDPTATHLFRLHAAQIRVTYIPYAPIIQAF